MKSFTEDGSATPVAKTLPPLPALMMACSAAEHLGHFGVTQVPVEPQHHRCPLNAGQLAAQAPQPVGLHHLGGRITGDRCFSQHSRVRHRIGSAAPDYGQAGVHHAPRHIRLEPIPLRQPRPARIQRSERIMDRVASVLPIPGDQPRQPQQAGRPCPHIAVERHTRTCRRNHSRQHHVNNAHIKQESDASAFVAGAIESKSDPHTCRGVCGWPAGAGSDRGAAEGTTRSQT